MTLRHLVWGAVASLGLVLGGFGVWWLNLPAVPAKTVVSSVVQSEMDAMVASLKPVQERPLVAVIGLNDATEGTDYLMPAGILRRADIADVVLLAAEPGPVRLYLALTVEADATVTMFDARHPEGADYVIVPAMSRDRWVCRCSQALMKCHWRLWPMPGRAPIAPWS